MPPQLIALFAALSYSVCIISARRGMKYSTPATVTLVSLIVHSFGMSAAVFLTGGIPDVSPVALGLFVLAGSLQPIIRMFTYTGVAKIGASRSYPLRATAPIFSALIAILFLREEASTAIVAGTLSVVIGVMLISWQPGEHMPSFRWWYLLIPLGAAFLAGIVHPIRRYALGISKEPLFFAAVVGVVSLTWYLVYLAMPFAERPLWHRKALVPFISAGIFESLGILFGIIALSVGTVVVVSPIISTSPMWVLFGTVIFLRDLEKLTLRTVLGSCCVVGGTITISVWG